MNYLEQVAADAAELGQQLTPEAREVLKEWHRRQLGECTAYSEGQACCIDYLLGDGPKG